MNFVSGLPRIQRDHNVIWVIINQLIKLAYFLPMKIRFPLKKLGKPYLEEIVRLHRIPVSIVLNRDFQFVSQF